MLTGLVLTSIAAGGLTVLSAPLAFQGLLDLRYPQPRKGPDRKPVPPPLPGRRLPASAFRRRQRRGDRPRDETGGGDLSRDDCGLDDGPGWQRAVDEARHPASKGL